MCICQHLTQTIIMEDWNTVVGEGVVGEAVGPVVLGMRNERDRIVDFCKQYDMTIANTFQNIRGEYQGTLHDTKSTIYWLKNDSVIKSIYVKRIWDGCR